MALSQKHTVSVNVVMTGQAAKTIALQQAVELAKHNDYFDSDRIVLTARDFEKYLNSERE